MVQKGLIGCVVFFFSFFPMKKRRRRSTTYIEFKNWNDSCLQATHIHLHLLQILYFSFFGYIARSQAKSETLFCLKMVILLTKISTWGGARGNHFKVRGIWMVLKFLAYNLCHNILYQTHPDCSCIGDLASNIKSPLIPTILFFYSLNLDLS